MDAHFHHFCELFAQLGLPSDDRAIHGFIAEHAPLPGHVRLEDAQFWSPAQAQLLRETLVHDADWAEVVDDLNLALRHG